MEKITNANKRYSIASLHIKLKKAKFQKKEDEWVLYEKVVRTSKTNEMIGLLVEYDVLPFHEIASIDK